MGTKFLSQNQKVRDYFVGLVLAGRMILKRILGKQGVRVLTGFMWLMTGSSGENDDESWVPQTQRISRPLCGIPCGVKDSLPSYTEWYEKLVVSGIRVSLCAGGDDSLRPCRVAPAS
jgi:hypothetical protein